MAFKKIQPITTPQKSTSRYSSYWFDEEEYSYGGWGSYGGYGKTATAQTGKDDLTKMLKLAAFMRSTKNFVNILTGRSDITVKYKSGNDSYTDGKTVTLSADVEGNFDSTVGLALHEASHIVKTDFKLLEKMSSNPADRRQFVTDSAIEQCININPKIENWDYSKLIDGNSFRFDKAQSKAHRAADVFLFIQLKSLINWIEDRRIDSWVYRTAIGYRGYYEALYDRYFYSEEVNTMLKENKMYNDESFDSYMFRIINLINPNTDLDVLKGLREINALINVPKVDRFTNTTEVAQTSSQVLDVILKYAKALDWTNLKQQQATGEGDGTGDGMEIDLDKMSDKECKEMFGMSKKQLKELLKKAKGQSDFVNGNIIKVTLSQEELQNLETLKDGNVTMSTITADEFRGGKTEVITIRELNETVLKTLAGTGVISTRPRQRMTEWVNQGVALGRMLGRRIQTRNEERVLKTTRQDSGKIDRRLVHALGYEVENVFSKLEVDKYSKAHVHISIDASGSMDGGEKIERSVKMATAVAVACDMNKNLECVVSFRTTHQSNGAHRPIVYVAYDSRRNKISHLRKYFSHVVAEGTTPESLCYETMMKEIFPRMQHGEQFYFVNLSDGEPYFESNTKAGRISYSGSGAYKHCKRMVDKMRNELGALILSYFVDDGTECSSGFKQMYGADNAFAIDMGSVEQIARTLNKKFMQSVSKQERGNV